MTFPREIARWGAKMAQTRELLARHGSVIGNLLGDCPEAREINARLEDLKLANQIQVENPDQPWAYRTALKSRLTDRPRSEIVQVKHEGLTRVAHPEDKRRKEYLVALGAAATRARPAADDLRNLEKFSTPFDPLVSIYVHYELAELLARAEIPDPATRLQHCLHTVYYAAAEDHSVRTICTTVNLICQHPDAIPDPGQRWDQLNSLLEMLELRWQLRWNDARSSRYEPIDTEKSITAVEQSLRELEQLATEHPHLGEAWNHRRNSVESSLLRHLRTHRSQQLGRYQVTPVAARPTGSK